MGGEILCYLGRTVPDECLHKGGKEGHPFVNDFKCEVLRTASVEGTSEPPHGEELEECGAVGDAELWATRCFLRICFVTLGPVCSHGSLGCHGNSIRLGGLESQFGQCVPLDENHVLLVLSLVKVRTLAWPRSHLSAFLPNPVIL